MKKIATVCLLLLIATGIMLLVRDGKVRLDEPVKTYLDDAPAAWSGITRSYSNLGYFTLAEVIRRVSGLWVARR